MEDSAQRPLRSYGRVQSRKLKSHAAGLMEALLPQLALADGPIVLTGETWVEIGFGGGEHLAHQAATHPGVAFIGAEPFVNGMASMLTHVERGGQDNIRLLHGDGRDLLARLPDASVARIFLLFPDPWPKARHNKRRFIQTETVDEIARVLKPGGSFRFATDVADYADWAIERLAACEALERLTDDPSIPPADHFTTRYEQKRLGDIAPVYFDFRRR